MAEVLHTHAPILAEEPGKLRLLSDVYTWLTVAAVALCYVAALVIRPVGEPTFHFEESGAITAMSVILLSLSAGFAFAIYLLRYRQPLRVRTSWLLMAAGFVFLAFDEHAELHERIGGVLDPIIAPSAYGLPDTNDLIVVLYGFAAIPAAMIALPELVRVRHTILLFGTAMVFFIIHTAIDSIDIEADPFWFIAEETAKIISVMTFFIALLRLLMSNAHSALTNRAARSAER